MLCLVTLKTRIEIYTYQIFCLSRRRPFPRGFVQNVKAGRIWNWKLAANMKVICRLSGSTQPTPQSQTVKYIGYETGSAGFREKMQFAGILGCFWPGGGPQKMKGRVQLPIYEIWKIQHFSKSHDLANVKVIRWGFCSLALARNYWEETTISDHLHDLECFRNSKLLYIAENDKTPNQIFVQNVLQLKIVNKYMLAILSCKAFEHIEYIHAISCFVEFVQFLGQLISPSIKYFYWNKYSSIIWQVNS